jgi:hypothetical protein
MSTSLVLRPLPILLAAATLVACSSEQRPQPESIPAHAPTNDGKYPVGDTSIRADVPIGPGWEVAIAPIAADVPIGPGWDAS